MLKVSIVIPTFNESHNITLLLEKLNRLSISPHMEVIVVDDDSPDKTWEVARQLGAHQYPWLKVIRRIHDKGLSSAVLAGFAVAEAPFLVVMDADLQHDEQIIPQFVEQLESGSDIVVGSRKSDGGAIENWSIIRRFISFVATLLAKIALSQPSSDPMSGFFAINQTTYSLTRNEINPKGFKILLEFLARSKGLRVTEVGYTFKSRQHGESKLSSQVIFQYLKALYELSLGVYFPVQFLKYCAVGVSGFIVSQIVLWSGLNVFQLSTWNALAFSIEFSIVTNFILNNSWTFREKKLNKLLPFFRGFVTFHAICLSGALINQAIALLFSSQYFMSLYLANACGYFMAAVWNYFINVSITWKTRVTA